MMHEALPFDEAALHQVSTIERAIRRLDLPQQGAFIAILNALEFHLEMPNRDPQTVRLIAQALARFSVHCDIDPAVAKFQKQLKALTEYAAP